MVTARHRVVVCGGSGHFGRLVVEDLLAGTDFRVTVVGRRARLRPDWPSGRVSSMPADQHDRDAMRRILENAAVVVHAAGPYQGLPPTLLETAIACEVPYVDLADDLDFYLAARRLDPVARAAGVAVVCGASFVPGLSCVLVERLRSGFDRIDSVRAFAAPGTHGSRGRATFSSLLSGAGRPLRTPGSARVRRGWSEPETIELPPPIGRRLTYLAIQVADFEIAPRCFAARAVEFRAGSEFAGLNRILALASRLRGRFGRPALERSSWLFSPAIRLLGLLGTDAGAGAVEVRGERGGEPVSEWLAVVAARGGARIPSLPAALAARALVEGRVVRSGVLALHEAIAPVDCLAGLELRGLELWGRAGEGAWRRTGSE